MFKVLRFARALFFCIILYNKGGKTNHDPNDRAKKNPRFEAAAMKKEPR